MDEDGEEEEEKYVLQHSSKRQINQCDADRSESLCE